MDLKLIKEILDLIAESDVDEVSLEEGDFKIKVKKPGTIETYSHHNIPIPYMPSAPANPVIAEPAMGTQGESPAPTNGEKVKSPIVGTFYQAPSPDSPPYVKVGDHVNKGQTLCIIEAMKIMNEIDAEFSGTVKEIIATEGAPVEFNQTLFIIQRD